MRLPAASRAEEQKVVPIIPQASLKGEDERYGKEKEGEPKEGERHKKDQGVRSRRISFASTPVTGVSRQPTNKEQWTLYYFEEHASKCSSCYNPQAVQKQGRALCDDGRRLATSVATLLFQLRADGHIYAKEDHEFVRIEMPAKYEHVLGLFKAIAACNNGIMQRSACLDRHFPVSVRSRIVGGTAAVAHDDEFDYDSRAAWYNLPSSAGSSSHRSSLQASSSEFPQRRSRKSRSSVSWSRGSLFEDDPQLEQLREERERRARYRHAVYPIRARNTWD
jgi:hypothetical protein